MTEKDLLKSCKTFTVYHRKCYITPSGLVFQISGFPKPSLVRVFDVMVNGKKFTHKHIYQGLVSYSPGVRCYPKEPSEADLKELNGLGILVKF